ncbi:acyl carrier protein [Mycobacterium szulgai]|uniref:Acyl carrier protein n=1 Tax=Mycobacterium szulgai TaxID=1787 RepID=A0A1X2ECT2_MYCSZ|nr:acyl carrier protein [Mycobacterium szulgai]MCV7076895.1 acyl carrier protein [Mycobacterium szulgai]ORW98182.1 acyl carrier protein [Mycobacterium szulgai]
MNSVEQSVLSVVARLAPDRMAPVSVESHLVEDLGYDSPRKMELVATLESHLQTRLHDPSAPLETVGEVIEWVNANLTVSDNA